MGSTRLATHSCQRYNPALGMQIGVNEVKLHGRGVLQAAPPGPADPADHAGHAAPAGPAVDGAAPVHAAKAGPAAPGNGTAAGKGSPGGKAVAAEQPSSELPAAAPVSGGKADAHAASPQASPPPPPAPAPAPDPVAPAAITEVRSAQELQQAIMTGKQDIHILAHLDLRGLQIPNNPANKLPANPENIKNTHTMYSSAPTRSIRVSLPQVHACLCCWTRPSSLCSAAMQPNLSLLLASA